jgi:hypothetical protein
LRHIFRKKLPQPAHLAVLGSGCTKLKHTLGAGLIPPPA